MISLIKYYYWRIHLTYCFVNASISTHCFLYYPRIRWVISLYSCTSLFVAILFVPYCLCRPCLLAFSVPCWLLSFPVFCSLQFSLLHFVLLFLSFCHHRVLAFSFFESFFISFIGIHFLFVSNSFSFPIHFLMYCVTCFAVCRSFQFLVFPNFVDCRQISFN